MNLPSAVEAESAIRQRVRTYVDSSSLISIVRGPVDVSQRAVRILGDDSRLMLSSQFVQLETLPKALFHRREDEITIYEDFFRQVETFATLTDTLVSDAFALAIRWNLSGFDALHVAAAIQLNAEELNTSERPTSPLSRVAEPGLTIISIRESSPQE